MGRIKLLPLKASERLFRVIGAKRINKKAKIVLRKFLEEKGKEVAELATRNASHFGRKEVKDIDVKAPRESETFPAHANSKFSFKEDNVNSPLCLESRNFKFIRGKTTIPHFASRRRYPCHFVMKKTIQNQYIKIAKEFTKLFIKDLNVVEITLPGGISRGLGDKFSEIDLNFYVKNKKDKRLPPKWDINVNGVWFDFHIYGIKEELRQKWEMDKRWDCKYAKILFERNKVITKLFEKKLNFTRGEKKKLLRGLGEVGHWSASLAEIFIQREDLKNTHMPINNSLNGN